MQADSVTCAYEAALPLEDNNRTQNLATNTELFCSVCDTRLLQAEVGIFQNRIVCYIWLGSRQVMSATADSDD